MGVVLALLSAGFYALDTTLMTLHYRRMNAFLAVGLRGLCIAVTGTVLLFFVPATLISEIPAALPWLLLAGLTACIANWGFASSTHYFPVGIANVSVMAIQVLVMAILGALFFEEYLDLKSIFLISLVVGANIFLALQTYSSNHQFHSPIWKGLFFCLVNGVFQSISFIILAKISRELSPFLAAYFWEVFIGVFGMAFALLMPTGKEDKYRFADINGHTIASILVRSAATVPAVAMYAFATTLTQVAVVQAIFTSVALFSSILGSYLFQERLSAKQISGLIILVIVIAMFKYLY